MSDRRRPGGVPLVVYLTLLVMVPLLALLFVGGREVRRNADSADAAQAVAETIDNQTTAIDVLAPLQVERITALGTVRLDEVEIDLTTVDPRVAGQLIVMLNSNSDVLDNRLDEFEAVLIEVELAELESRLGASRSDIEELRAGIETSPTAITEIDSVYRSVLAIVDEFLRATTQVIADANPAAFDAERLVLEHTLGGLALRTANDEVSEIADVFLGLEEFELRELAASASLHESTLEQLDDVSSNPELVTELQSDRAELSPFLDDWIANGPVTPQNIAVEPALYNRFLELLVERLAYLEQVEDFTAAAGDDIVDFAGGFADETGSDSRRTLIGLLLVAAVVLAFGLVIGRTIARPLGRLRGHAKRIGDGELAVEPLPVGGPSDVRRVTESVNEMAGTLVSVDARLRGLAAGETATDDDIPGPVGASLRVSFDRLTALTSELRESEERLQDEARHDGLTGHFNRFGVVEYLDEVLAAETPDVGVLIVDLDGFKKVNDTNGQAVGDRVLREVADRLAAEIGPQDVIARIGGDDFLIVAQRCPDADAALALGRRLIARVEEPYAEGELILSLTASVGAQVVTEGATALSAFEGADAAVYHAKGRGRGRVEMYDAELQSTIEHAAEIEFALRQGVAAGELRLHLQPTVDATTGQFDGAEALVRWERPGIGLVSPGQFIPIAERTGLIIEVGRWVIDEACRLVALWRDRDPSCSARLAVNISGRHLMEGDLLADLDAALAASGADPSMLEFELTESHLMADVERARRVLDVVRSRGVTISVDDFGTGHSSMTYLQQLPLDAVKVDRAFVERAARFDFDSMVIDSVVRLAGALSLDVVAEGVEEPDQLRIVRERGVDRLQGFLLARPVPIEEAEAILFSGPPLDLDALGAA